MASSQSEQRRQAMLDKQRQDMMSDFDRQREALIKETEKSRPGSNRFTSQSDSMEETLKKQTIGLVNLDEFQRRRAELEEQKARQAAMTDDIKEDKKKKKKKKAAPKSTLSFALDDEEGGGDDAEVIPGPTKKRKDADAESGDVGASASNGNDENATVSAESQTKKKVRLMKNPSVDTSFLPDREREEEERRIREQLRQEWIKRQEETKKEEIEIVYSWWDGSGHRKAVKCLKGDNIGMFLEKCRQQIPELRGISVDNMMYVKEDLIIPHHYTFYDFIINKARGKSGPLFNFDVHDDVRMLADATVEKDESHAGKVVERAWYQRSKHIFPASRWEIFDPEKNYGKYTIA